MEGMWKRLRNDKKVDTKEGKVDRRGTKGLKVG